jgi:hypothetical protein
MLNSSEAKDPRAGRGASRYRLANDGRCLIVPKSERRQQVQIGEAQPPIPTFVDGGHLKSRPEGTGAVFSLEVAGFHSTLNSHSDILQPSR